MVLGHTKFSSGDKARQTAGVFNVNDTFNQGMLLGWVNSCAIGVPKLVVTCMWASQLHFKTIPEILSLRYFWIFGDDGSMELNLGKDG
jgi:hypothetical protein